MRSSLTRKYISALSVAALFLTPALAQSAYGAETSRPVGKTVTAKLQTPDSGQGALQLGAETGSSHAVVPEKNGSYTITVTLKLPGKTQAERNRQQKELLEQWQQKYHLKIERVFDYLINGFSASIPVGNFAAIATEPSIINIHRTKLSQPKDLHSRELLDVNALESKYRNVGDYDGKGIVVSVIDTGIDPTHQDMRIEGWNSAQPTVCPDYVAIKTVSAEKITHVDMDGTKTEMSATCKVPFGYNYADKNNDFTDADLSEQHGMHVAGIIGANGTVDASGKEIPNVIPGFGPGGNHREVGIIPNAQLLAMKVFSNLPGAKGARDDDIVQAIIDSVKKGADVINMSLGSSNGFNDPNEAEQAAIADARAKGVLVDVAASNDGRNFGDEPDAPLDDQTLGSPATSAAAFSVAAMTNSYVYGTPLTITKTGDSELYLAAQHADQLAAVEGKDLTFYYAGLGDEADYNAICPELKDNWVLTLRGKNPFSAMVERAAACGAKGLLVMNKESEPGSFIGMAGIEDSPIFVGSVFAETGIKLRNNLTTPNKVGGSVVLQLSGQISEKPVGQSHPKPASFTSWGPTPSLDVKPEIAGIGVNVYSTQNHNKYVSMDGTSMATPNLAGVSGLMMQAYRERGWCGPAGNNNAACTDLIRWALMNTAAQYQDDKTHQFYLPRQVGAGLAQADRALKTRVFASFHDTDDLWKGAVALRTITGPSKEFEIRLQNKSEKPVTFNLPQTITVENEDRSDAGKIHPVAASDENVKPAVSSVTVAPGQESLVKFTITAANRPEHYVEGYIPFESQDPNQPNLSVPFLGFVGKWDQSANLVEPTGDDPYPRNPGEDDEAYALRTRSVLITPGKHGDAQLVDPEAWYAPDESNGYRFIPQVSPKRNLKLVRFSVVDANKKHLLALGSDSDIPRPLGTKPDYQAYRFTDKAWDGMLVDKVDETNPSEPKMKPAPDGKYFILVESQNADDGTWQKLYLPVNLDSTAPVIGDFNANNKGDGLEVTVPVTDASSGVAPVDEKNPNNSGVTVEVIPAESSAKATLRDNGNGTYTIDIDKRDGVTGLNVYATDKAGNATSKTYFLASDTPRFAIQNAAEVASAPSDATKPFPPSAYWKGEALQLAGYSTPGIAKLQVVTTAQSVVDGELPAPVRTEADVDPADGFFILPAKAPKDGHYQAVVTALDENGEPVAGVQSQTIEFNADRTAPVVSGMSEEDQILGARPVDADGTWTINAKVSDAYGSHYGISPQLPVVVSINTYKGNTEPGDPDAPHGECSWVDQTQGTFTCKISPGKDDSDFAALLIVKDAAGNLNDIQEDYGNILILGAAPKAPAAKPGEAQTNRVGMWLKDNDVERSTWPKKSGSTVNYIVHSNSSNLDKDKNCDLDKFNTGLSKEKGDRVFTGCYLFHGILLDPQKSKANAGEDGYGPSENPEAGIAPLPPGLKITQVTFYTYATPNDKGGVSEKKVSVSLNGDSPEFDVNLPYMDSYTPWLVEFSGTQNVHGEEKPFTEKGRIAIFALGKKMLEGDIHAVINTPELVNGSIVTKTPEAAFTGAVTSQYAAYRLFVNGSEISSHLLDSTVPHNHPITRSFSAEAVVKDGEKAAIQISSLNSEPDSVFVPVVVDNKAPTISGTAKEISVVADGSTQNVTATDEHLASLQVTVLKKDQDPKLICDAKAPYQKSNLAYDNGKWSGANPPSEWTKELKCTWTAKLTDGVYNLQAVDAAGNVTTEVMVVKAAPSEGGNLPYIPAPSWQGDYYDSTKPAKGYTRYGGADRVETSLQAWKATGSNVMLLAGYDAPVDAVAGGALAGAYGSAVVFTKAHGLDGRVAEAIRKDGVHEVLLLGGNGVISDAVVAQLKQLGVAVERLGGRDRYETAVAIANASAKRLGTSLAKMPLVFASGESYIDALVAGPLAAKLQGAVLLTKNLALPAVTAKVAAANTADKYAVGGWAARVTSSYGVASYAGKDRYESAVAVANKFFSGADVPLGIANGQGGYDALSGAGLVAAQHGGLLLVKRDVIPPTVAQVVAGHTRFIVFGGEGAVSAAVAKELVR